MKAKKSKRKRPATAEEKSAPKKSISPPTPPRPDPGRASTLPVWATSMTPTEARAAMRELLSKANGRPRKLRVPFGKNIDGATFDRIIWGPFQAQLNRLVCLPEPGADSDKAQTRLANVRRYTAEREAFRDVCLEALECGNAKFFDIIATELDAFKARKASRSQAEFVVDAPALAVISATLDCHQAQRELTPANLLAVMRKNPNAIHFHGVHGSLDKKSVKSIAARLGIRLKAGKRGRPKNRAQTPST